MVTVLASDAPRVALAQRFVAAYNDADMQAVLALLSDNPTVSDCDYASSSAVEFRGRAEVTSWLVARFADHDHLDAAIFENSNPDPTTSAVGVGFARRTSDTLRRLGFANGIKPSGGAKIRFAGSGDSARIDTFANSPIGGPASSCKPS